MTTDENKPFYIYVLLTENNTYYCGYTDNVEARFKKHLEGTGAKYTKSHKPVKIVFQKEYKSKSEAMKAERQFKSLNRKQKEAIINNYFLSNKL